MALYRILTENKNDTKVLELTSRYFPGFTVYHAIGYWHGKQERTIIIEIMTCNPERPITETRIKELCETIRELNNQKCVLLQQIECVGIFI